MPERRLTPARRQAALFKIEAWIAELQTEIQVRHLTEKRYGVSSKVAKTLYDEAVKGLRYESEQAKDERRGMWLAAVGRLYRKADTQGRLAVCARLLDSVKRMQGLDAPLKIQNSLPIPEDDFDTRSEAELDYFNAHGHWPEEAPKAPGKTKARTPTPSTDPLDRLH